MPQHWAQRLARDVNSEDTGNCYSRKATNVRGTETHGKFRGRSQSQQKRPTMHLRKHQDVCLQRLSAEKLQVGISLEEGKERAEQK